ncbi:hypothetical protein ACHAPT_008753 [Fusarium lateritium]
MSPPPARVCFLTIPREFRCLVYRFYFKLEGGYVFNRDDPYNGKLTTADSHPINLSLMYVCRLITAETKADSAVNLFLKEFEDWAEHIDVFGSAELLKQAIRELSAVGFGIMPVIRRPFRRYASLDQLQSTFHQAAAYTLSLLRQKEPARFQGFIKVIPGRFKPHEFDDLRLDPWAIPSPAKLEKIGHRLQDEEVWESLQEWRYPPDQDQLRRGPNGRLPWGVQLSETRSYLANNVCFREAFHFSAAAVAIRFLERLSPAHRLNLRRIVLHEDHISIGQPECHALGLVQFCRENPRLGVERYVSIWRNILHEAQPPGFECLPEVVDDVTKGERKCGVHHGAMKDALGFWFGEALALADAGMPAGPFTLIVDGNPAINLSSEMFQDALQRILATELAYRRCFNTDPGQPGEDHVGSWARRHLIRGMHHLNNQASIIRCNFNPVLSWDIDRMVEERREWPMEAWENEFGGPEVYDYNDGLCVLSPPC